MSCSSDSQHPKPVIFVEFIYILPRLSYVCPDFAQHSRDISGFCPKGHYTDILSSCIRILPISGYSAARSLDSAKDLGRIEICHNDISGFCPQRAFARYVIATYLDFARDISGICPKGHYPDMSCEYGQNPDNRN